MSRYVIYAAALALGACAGMQAVPPALDPPAGEELAMVLRAEGVQVYECRAGKSANGCGPDERDKLAGVAYTADHRMFAAR